MKARLVSRHRRYRALRRFFGPVFAYRLAHAWRA